jgi:hypothetical protein
MNNKEITYAFPDETSYGMTLRDYFAAKAMQGQLSIRENVTALAREQIKLEDVCTVSYEVADAMMKARDKNET